jgi:potassium-dependent mechanosensitive channel
MKLPRYRYQRLLWVMGGSIGQAWLTQHVGLAQTVSPAPTSLPVDGSLPTLVGDGIEAVLIIAGAVTADILLRKFWRRGPKQTTPSPRPWRDLGLVLFKQGLRWSLWLGALVLLIWQVSFFRATQTFLEPAWEILAAGLRYVLFFRLFQLGKEPITLAQLLLFFGITLGVFILSQVLSNWLKQSILRRLGLERGSQEAIASVVGYVFAALAMVIMLQTVGIDLSSLAVVAGVLGIGVGFGLQLLASNFISGVAILLEQPIHVGDFIEVDGLLGTVEKISFRSTTIRTNDGLVVIIPNNRFLEKAVINRSYRGTDTRLHIPVLVAIGSDMGLVTEALLAAARQERLVLAHPQAIVRFLNFGKGAYEMELLVWINQPQEFEQIQSDLNFLIEQEFSLRGIEIPLPQQELRLRHPQELLPLLSSIRQPETMSDLASISTPNLQTSTPHSGQTLRNLLRQIIYFQNCSDAELRILIEQGYQKVFPAASCIFREQDSGDAFYLILAGKVQVFSQKLNQPIATLGAGDFFGEISVLTGVPRSATVQTLAETTVFVVDQLALQKLLQRHRALAEQIAQELAQRQNILQELGILNTPQADAPQEVPLIWIRQRLRTLFGI